MDLATVDHLLTTTRSVKKRMDLSRPVEPEILERCIETALCAPTGGNYQGWHFMVVTDPDKRAGLTEYYRKGRDALATAHKPGYHPPQWTEGDPRRLQHQGMIDASDFMHEHFHEIPAHIIGCIEVQMKGVASIYEPTFEAFHVASLYGSILPAAWSIMLALRARGLGSAWTTAHLVYEKEVAQLLGIPDNVKQTVLLPVAYFTGTDFRPLKRRPLHEVTHWNGWAQRR
jgi:nitroreductase